MHKVIPYLLTALLIATVGCDRSTVQIAAGEGFQERLQEALITVEPGTVIQLPEGRFDLTDTLSLAVPGAVLQGAGPESTVLSFSGMQVGSGGEGLTVTADNVVLRDFGIEDTRSDGIKVKGVSNIQMLNLSVVWTRGPHPENGAYGLYPVESNGVLVDGARVSGSSDAGIYVGQSKNIVVRNSRVDLNVAGIEIENSLNADVYDNIATENTTGILVFDLPDLPMKGGGNVRVFRNQVHNNETENFAKPGAIVATVPRGVGVIVMANSRVAVYENEIRDNSTAGVVVTSYTQETEDADYYPHPEGIWIHGNRFGRTGWNPNTEKLGEPVSTALQGRGAAVLWDGITFEGYGDEVPADRRLYIENNEFTDEETRRFLNVAKVLTGMEGAEDQTPHAGSLPVKVNGSERQF
ncbi:MAG: right-handed parallel beta-helix repeat-containing protein [Gammaproteobacteria bacterium AqS3]|nr:right-handed parallel beta-helix repeat-containing protein [Gammaproteobacteria bacterium AqS3]